MAQVKSLQRGTTVISSGSASATQAINSVVTGSTIVFISYSVSDANPGLSLTTVILTSSILLTFNHVTSASAPAITVRWTVVEFDASVVVQRGTSSWDGAQTTVNTTITAVTANHALVLLNGRGVGTQYGGDDDFTRAELTTTTNLAISANTAPATSRKDIWQVVEFTDGTVTTQTGNISWGTGDPSKTAALTSVNTAKTWVVFTLDSAAGTLANIGQKLVDVVLTNATTLTFTRANTGQTMNLTWWLIEHNDATTVEHNTLSFGTGDTVKTATITAVDQNRTIVMAGGIYGRGGSSAYSADDNPHVSGVCDLNLSSATTVDVTRALTGSVAATVTICAVQFLGSSRFLIMGVGL